MGSTFRIYVGPSASRKDHKKGLEGSNALRGMGDIKSRAQVGFDAETDVGPVTLSASVQHAFKKGDDRDTGSAYTLFNLGASAKVYDGPAGKIGLSLNSTFGDGNYMRTWYGVRPPVGQVRLSQVRGRGRPGKHRAGRGVVVSAEQVLTLTAAAEARRLFGDAKDSPIVKERNQYSVGTMVTYTY